MAKKIIRVEKLTVGEFAQLYINNDPRFPEILKRLSDYLMDPDRIRDSTWKQRPVKKRQKRLKTT